MAIAQKIRKLRRDKNLTLTQLGEKIGIKGQGVSNYESGNSIPPIEKVEKLALALDTTVEYLLSNEEENETKNVKSTPSVIEEMKSTIDYLKGQVDLLNAERSRFLDLLEKSFPGGSSPMSSEKFFSGITPLKLVA